MVSMADFDDIGGAQRSLGPPTYLPDKKPVYVASYMPITPAGQMGLFNVNTYFLRDDRKSELASNAANRQFKVCGRS